MVVAAVSLPIHGPFVRGACIAIAIRRHVSAAIAKVLERGHAFSLHSFSVRKQVGARTAQQVGGTNQRPTHRLPRAKGECFRAGCAFDASTSVYGAGSPKMREQDWPCPGPSRREACDRRELRQASGWCTGRQRRGSAAAGWTWDCSFIITRACGQGKWKLKNRPRGIPGRILTQRRRGAEKTNFKVAVLVFLCAFAPLREALPFLPSRNSGYAAGEKIVSRALSRHNSKHRCWLRRNLARFRYALYARLCRSLHFHSQAAADVSANLLKIFCPVEWAFAAAQVVAATRERRLARC